MGNKKESLQFYMSTIQHSSRIEKECTSLINNGVYDRIVIFGIWEEGLKEHEFLSPQLEIVRAKLPVYKKKVSGIIKIIFGLYARISFCRQFVKYCKKMKPQSIGVHNPLIMSFAYSAAKKVGAKMIYVPHELERQRVGINSTLMRLTDWLEKKYLPKADGMTVVCEPIREWYEKEYNVEGIGVVPNIPVHPHPGRMTSKHDLYRSEFQIPEDHLIFVYIGIVDQFRGIKELLSVFGDCPEDRHLVLMGYGDMEEEIKTVAGKTTNIHFKSAVPHSEILNYASSADVGLWYCEKMPLSMTYALPNKFFQYVISGLYIAVSENFIEQQRFIRKEHLGTTVQPNKDSLQKFVTSVTREEISDSLSKSADFRKSVDWKQHSETDLLSVYRGELVLTQKTS